MVFTIKKARKKKRLTQKQLANLVGLSQSYISKLENNKNYYDKNLTVKTLLKLAKVLSLNPVLLFIEITGCCTSCKLKCHLKSK